MNEQKNKLVGHGLTPIEIADDHYIFGSQKLPDTIIQDNGDWSAFLPSEERQNRGLFDTYGCTIYNTLAPIETLERKLFGEDSDYSERHIYIESGTHPPGNDPHTIAEYIRNLGLILESSLPFDDTIQSLEQYASGMNQQLRDQASRWIKVKSLGHEWVWKSGTPQEKYEKLKEALRRSPIALSVCAWRENNGIYYKEDGDTDNHWTYCFSIEDGYPMIFDSYPPFVKKLDKNYNFGFAKRYFLDKKLIAIPKWTFFGIVRNYLSDIIA